MRRALFVVLCCTLTTACEKPRKAPVEPEAPPPATSTEKAPSEAPEKGHTAPPSEAPTPGKPSAPPESPAADESAAPPSTNQVLRVIVSPDLEPAVTRLAKAFTKATSTPVDVFAGALAEALRQMGSAGADVVVLDGYTSMEALRASSLLDVKTLRTVSHLELTVTIAGKHAGTITTLEQADRDGFKVGMPDPRLDVAARAARRLLDRAQVGERMQERVLPRAARASALKDGTVDLLIGWGRADAGVPLTLPATLREHRPVPAAVTTTAADRALALRFLEFLTADTATELWVKGGTSPRPAAGLPILPTVLPIKLPQPRRNAASVVVGERVLLIGGEGARPLLDTLVWVDPVGLTAQNAQARMPLGRELALAEHAISRRQVIIAGGRTTQGATRQMLRFELDSERLDTLESQLPLPLYDAASIPVDGVIWTFGGKTVGGALTDAIVRIDLDTGEVARQKQTLPAKQSGSVASPAPDGTIWLIGGEQEGGPTDQLMAFDPGAGTARRLTARLTQPLSHAAIVRYEGDWLIAGGKTHRGPRERIERLAPDGTSKTIEPRLPWPLSNATAERLHDRVWIVGGVSDTRVEALMIRFPL